MPLYVPLLFMALPLVLVTVFVLLLRRGRRVHRAIRTVPPGWVRAPRPGHVTAEETWRTSHSTYAGSSTGAVVHRPIVTFRPAAGGEITFRSGAYGTFMPRPGAQVGVFHDPADPARARIAPESVPRTFGAVAGVAAVVAVLVLVPLTLLFEGLGYFMLTHR